jgi:hypothetical protein
MTYDQLDTISTHPLHPRSAIRIRELITELRRWVRAANYMDFQARLYAERCAVDAYRIQVPGSR